MTLSVYSKMEVKELIEKYELASLDLANMHSDLSTQLADLHKHYLEVFAGSAGKSVAEKNREADYVTRSQFSDIIELRGKINYHTAMQTMFANLIAWKMRSSNPLFMALEYPPNKDSEVIGNGR